MRYAIQKFDEFKGNAGAFWAQPGVNRRMNSVWSRIETLEEAACDNRAKKSMIPIKELLNMAKAFGGVSPEMICDRIGQEIIHARRLQREKKKLGTILNFQKSRLSPNLLVF